MTTVPELQRNIAKAKRARSTRKKMEQAREWRSHTLAAIALKRATNPRPPLETLAEPMPMGDFS